MLRIKSTGEVVEVHSTTDFPFSPDGSPVWIDGEKVYCMVAEPDRHYDILEVDLENRYDIGIYLRYLRRLRHVSFSDLEEATGYSERTIKSIEVGKFSPSADVITDLLSALGSRLVAMTDLDYSCGIPEDRFGLTRIGNNVVVIDALFDLTVSFEVGRFNETQKTTVPTGTPDVMDIARAMREIGDWLQEYHPDLL